MINEEVIIKRKQMLRDGYCVIEKIIPEEFLDVLIKETETLIAKNNEQSDFVYQGQHIGVNQEENIVIRKLGSPKSIAFRAWAICFTKLVSSKLEEETRSGLFNSKGATAGIEGPSENQPKA